MKIAQVCPFFHPVVGGWETAVLNISKELQRRGHEVTVLTCNEMHDGSRIAESDSVVQGIPVKRFPVLFRVSDFYRAWPGFLRGLSDYDIVHVHNYRHFHCDASALLKRNYKVVMRTGLPFHPKEGLLSFMRDVYDKTMPCLLGRGVDKFFVYNSAERGKFARLGIPDEKMSEIPYGVEDLFFVKGNGERFRKKYNITGKMVLCAARLHKYKGIETLIHAVRELPAEITVVIAGDGEEKYARELSELAKEEGVEGRVLFVRDKLKRSELRDAYAACDVFVLPSVFESYGIAVLEAMAQGCAVIASRTEGPAGIIKEGCTGVLFEPSDNAELAEKIRMLIADNETAKMLGRNAQEYAQGLRWGKIVDLIEKEYELL